MLKFADSEQREWDLKIHLGICNRLRDAKVIDLMKITENKMARYRELMTNPYDLVGVVWEIVKPQAEARKITLDQFIAGLDGDAIDSMMDVFGHALADFFPALRAVILKGMEKSKQTKQLASTKSVEMIDQVDPELLVRADLATAKAEMEKIMVSPGTSSPGDAAAN